MTNCYKFCHIFDSLSLNMIPKLSEENEYSLLHHALPEGLKTFYRYGMGYRLANFGSLQIIKRFVTDLVSICQLPEEHCPLLKKDLHPEVCQVNLVRVC